jgi:hypothetical protein
VIVCDQFASKFPIAIRSILHGFDINWRASAATLLAWGARRRYAAQTFVRTGLSLIRQGSECHASL